MKDTYEQFFRSDHCLDRMEWAKLSPPRTRAAVCKTAIEGLQAGFQGDKDRLRDLSAQYLDRIRRGQEPTEELADFLHHYRDALEAKIKSTASSSDKAKALLLGLIDSGWRDCDQIYDAMTLLRESIPESCIRDEIRIWKRQYKDHKTARPEETFDAESEIFWTSLDFRDVEDSVSRYLFRDSFNIGEFESTFSEIESELACSLVDGLDPSEIVSAGKRRVSSTYLPLPINLWIISRSSTLCSRLRTHIDIALRRIASWQAAEGWWTHPIENTRIKKDPSGLEFREYYPSTYATAVCSLVLVKLATSSQLFEQGLLGLRWLLSQQEPVGCWSQAWIRESKRVNEPDFLATLWALEGLSRSGLKNIERSIDLGTDWLKGRQTEFGGWEYDGFPYVWITTLTLEYLETKASLRPTLDHYLSLGKGLISRSIQISRDDATESPRLAIVSAYHGLEAFLYSVLSTGQVNKPIFRDKNETIGFRKALDVFEEWLLHKGMLPPGSQVLYRNDLDNLAHLRDEVIHKALDVTAADGKRLADVSLRFARHYAKSALGYDPWE